LEKRKRRRITGLGVCRVVQVEVLMQWAKVLLLLCFSVAASYGHLCMQQPPQIGGYTPSALTVPGVADCAQTVGPCGNAVRKRKEGEGEVRVMERRQIYRGGVVYSVRVILSAQHLNTTSPGRVSLKQVS